jgi:predicted kinase
MTTPVVINRELFVLIGVPFSGKTTIAKRLCREGDLLLSRDEILEGLYQDTEVISRMKEDAKQIPFPRSRLFSTGVENAFNDLLTTAYVEIVADLFRKSGAPRVIVDGTHLQALSRSFVAEASKSMRCVAFWMNVSVDECVFRFHSSRELVGIRSTLTEKKIREMNDYLEIPTRFEGFDEIRNFLPESPLDSLS